MLRESPFLLLPSQQQFTLHTSLITIGRDHGNMVVLRNKDVSDYHARLVRIKNGYILEDAGSHYGTRLNGRPVYEPTMLNHGDEIALGKQRIIYYGDGRPRPNIQYGYYLRIRSGHYAGHRVDLTAERATLGRDDSNDIIIHEKQISRQHMVFTKEEDGDGYAIEDLRSTNGTYVNGHQVTNPRMLNDGDIITVGNHIQISFERAPLENAPEPQPLPHREGVEGGTTMYDRKVIEAVESMYNDNMQTDAGYDDYVSLELSDKPDLFLSYCHADTRYVKQIVNDLERAGFNLWIDWQDLKPGTPIWEQEIKKALKSTKAVIAILSPEAEQSAWVARELAMAEMMDQRIYPMLLRGAPIESIPLRLSTHQFVDIRTHYDRGITSLIETLKIELR